MGSADSDRRETSGARISDRGPCMGWGGQGIVAKAGGVLGFERRSPGDGGAAQQGSEARAKVQGPGRRRVGSFADKFRWYWCAVGPAHATSLHSTEQVGLQV
jgi:hypothetical protein